MRSQSLAAKIGLVVVAVVALSACGSKPVAGVLLATTGDAASYGESMKEGIDLAIEVAQQDGTFPSGLEILWGDSATDPATAVAEYKRLADAGAKIIVAGITSDSARAVLPVLEDTNTVCLSPSASAPDLTKDSKRFFRVFASDELEGRRAGRFLREDQDEASVLIYAENSEQARGIEPPFRQDYEQARQGKVVGKINIGGSEWTQESADLLAAHNPESVYIIGYADGTLEVLRHLREKGYEGTICVTSAFYSGEVIDQYPDLVEGVYFPQPAFDMKDERGLVKNFVDRFRERHGHDPDIYAAHAYDAMRVVFTAIEEAGVFETQEIRKAMLHGVKEFPGVTGIIQFNDYGDVHHNPIIFTIREGEVLNYERFIKEEKERIRARIRELLKGGG